MSFSAPSQVIKKICELKGFFVSVAIDGNRNSLYGFYYVNWSFSMSIKFRMSLTLKGCEMVIGPNTFVTQINVDPLLRKLDNKQ